MQQAAEAEAARQRGGRDRATLGGVDIGADYWQRYQRMTLLVTYFHGAALLLASFGSEKVIA